MKTGRAIHGWDQSATDECIRNQSLGLIEYKTSGNNIQYGLL